MTRRRRDRPITVQPAPAVEFPAFRGECQHLATRWEGSTPRENPNRVREAPAFHLEGLRENGQPLPKPTGSAVDVDPAVQGRSPTRRST